eukprot:jgi/Chrzof1/9496/Cz04g05100.t1
MQPSGTQQPRDDLSQDDKYEKQSCQPICQTQAPEQSNVSVPGVLQPTSQPAGAKVQTSSCHSSIPEPSCPTAAHCVIDISPHAVGPPHAPLPPNPSVPITCDAEQPQAPAILVHAKDVNDGAPVPTTYPFSPKQPLTVLGIDLADLAHGDGEAFIVIHPRNASTTLSKISNPDPAEGLTPQASTPAPPKRRFCWTTPGWIQNHPARALGFALGCMMVLALVACVIEYGLRGFHRVRLQAMTNPSNNAEAALSQLMSMYDVQSGLFDDGKAVWWNQPNCMETIIDYSMITGSRQYLEVIDNTFEKNKLSGFLNDWYDDEGWWAIAWVKAYELTRDEKYLIMAQRIFQDMQTGWDDTTCNGGLLWKKNYPYKSTISNLLYMQTALMLYSHVKDSMYLNTAQQALAWFHASGLLQPSGRVWDGIWTDDSVFNHKVYVYNQGVLVGVLIQMYKVTAQESYLQLATKVANVGLNDFSLNGILAQDCEPNDCNCDGTQFKGVYIRYIRQLYTVLGRQRGLFSARNQWHYQQFLLRQADSIWRYARNATTNQLAVAWAGPPPTVEKDVVMQVIGVDVLNAALAIQLQVFSYQE